MLRGSTMAPASTLEAVLRRDRLIVVAGLVGVAALAWLYLVVMAAGMHMSMPMGEAMAMPQIRPWSAVDFVLMFLMWAIMMVGMMVPGAAPMILLYARVCRTQRDKGRPFAPTGAFLAGYVAVWAGFSLAATVLQWALEQAALLSPMMVSTSPILGGGLLIAAGIYQLSPLKHVCLKHCRGPLDFITRHWRTGTAGAFVMGIEHGAYCVGCCWILMGLLFVGGVMNLLWVAGIAILVLLEKVAPLGELTARAGGVALAGAGLVLLLTA
jgi:predicted metal-binding membrane protein